jgi:hypothetical protein
MSTERLQEQPTTTRPLLVGILIDVSASMVSSSLHSESGSADPADSEASADGGPAIMTRIQSVSKALDDLVARGAELSQQQVGARVAPLLKVFIYGFGFGGVLSSVLSWVFGGNKEEKPKVRDLLALPGKSGSTVGIDQLALNWPEYRRNIESMLPDMLGDTPMASAMQIARDRIHHELGIAQFAANPILFIVSDGEPSPEEEFADSSAAVREIAREMKTEGVTVISCLLTREDVAEPRRLHTSEDPNWPAGARLLFDCASEVPAAFNYLLSEFGWTAGAGARIFAQINHTEVLSEFSKLALSRIVPEAPAIHEASGSPPPPSSMADASRPIRIFVSYSHRDSRYLKTGELIDYLSGLERDGIELWSDEHIETGEEWDARIRNEIANTDIVLALVSQAFLNSRYCQDVEMRAFLEQRKSVGLQIFPVIISPCDWQSYSWLSATQVQPRKGTVETEFTTRGKRAELYLKILNELRTIASTKAKS